jgi:hypothetical protein
MNYNRLRELYLKYDDKEIKDKISKLEAKVKEKEIILYKNNLRKFIDSFHMITDILSNTDAFDFYEKNKSYLKFVVPSKEYDDISVSFNIAYRISSMNVVFKTHGSPKYTFEIFIDDESKREEEEKNYIYDDWRVLNDIIDIFMEAFEIKLKTYLSDREKHLKELENKYNELKGIKEDNLNGKNNN